LATVAAGFVGSGFDAEPCVAAGLAGSAGLATGFAVAAGLLAASPFGFASGFTSAAVAAPTQAANIATALIRRHVFPIVAPRK